MARIRKSKLRAQRIELDYFARRHPMRTWRLWLSLLGLAVTAGWVATVLTGGDMTPASPGPMSPAQAMLEARCEACHASATRPEAKAAAAPAEMPAARVAGPWLGVTDVACRTCHDVPDHESNQSDTPACASCHVEHRRKAALAAVATGHCTRCHAGLDAHTRGEPRLVGVDGRQIRSFDDGHPEFAVWTRRTESPHRERLDRIPPPRDTAQLKFTHAKHLEPDLPGPAGMARVQLVCADCHQGPMALAAWRFGKQPPGWSPATAPDLAPAEEPAYMAPVRYQQHCATCHPHTFGDDRFPDLPAPHDTPPVIRAFLNGLYANYVVSHPEELSGPPRTRPIAEGATTRSAPSADEWVRAQVLAADAVLFRESKHCQLCHVLEEAPASDLPTVTPTRVPIRWLPQSRFDHGVHRLLRCTECHAAPQSTETADILLPRRETCQTCHRPRGARNHCAECHTYHAANTPVDMNGPLTIRAVASGAR